MVRLQQERLLLDLRTVNPEQDGLLLKAILAAVGMDGPEK